jgi:hypothetical protein
MSQILGLAGTIGWIVIFVVVVLVTISPPKLGDLDEDTRKALAASRSRPNQAAAGDDLRHRIVDIEEKLDVHRKHIIRIERRLIGAGVIIWALICALVSVYALGRNDWAPGLCFLAMAISFGIYGLVNVFSTKQSRQE